jgi:hypothetical protein
MSFWAKLPWRTVAFIVIWPVLVNIIGRVVWMRITRNRYVFDDFKNRFFLMDFYLKIFEFL